MGPYACWHRLEQADHPLQTKASSLIGFPVKREQKNSPVSPLMYDQLRWQCYLLELILSWLRSQLQADHSPPLRLLCLSQTTHIGLAYVWGGGIAHPS